MNQIWTEIEKQFIRDNAATMKDKELAEELTRKTGRIITTQSVRKQRQKLGIQKKQGRGVCGVVGKENKTPNSELVTAVKREI